MKTKSLLGGYILPMAACLALCSGCLWLRKERAITALDDLEKTQSYWGRISASGPHWIADTNQFKVNFNEDPTNYAAAARGNVAGGQASSIETSLYLGQALQGTFTPPISTGSPSGAGGTNTTPLPQIPNQAQAALSNFAPVVTLGNTSPVIDERQAASKAINDKIAEQLLELISSPTFSSNKQQVLFGLMQVTCQPGQQTKSGFMADLSITLNYGHYVTNVITNADNEVNWSVSAEDMTNLPALQAALASPANQVTTMLLEKMINYKEGYPEMDLDSSRNTSALQTNAVDTLNLLINGQKSIYDEALFHGVWLRPETTELLHSNLSGASLARLNRLLLEDAFPAILARNHKGEFTAVMDGNKFERCTSAYPTVLAVLPLIDSENVQLQHSDRKQVELAQALAAAFAAKGLNAAANSLADYIKRQQSDVDTRNALPIATTYATGSTYGFQIYPSLQAIAQPGKSSSGSGNILQPITFPAVVVLRIDKSDLMQGKSPDEDISKTPWNQIVADIRTRWIRLKRPHFYPIFAHAFWYGNIFASSPSLRGDLRQAKDLDVVERENKKLRKYEADFPEQFQAMLSAYNAGWSTSASAWTAEYFYPEELFKKPDTNSPVISDVFPHLVWRNTNTTFAILGTNLERCTEVTIAGIKATRLSEQTIRTATTNKNPRAHTYISGKLDQVEIRGTLGKNRPIDGQLGSAVRVFGDLGSSLYIDGTLGASVTIRGFPAPNRKITGYLGADDVFDDGKNDGKLKIDAELGPDVLIGGLSAQNVHLFGEFALDDKIDRTKVETVFKSNQVIFATLPVGNSPFRSLTNSTNTIEFVVSCAKGQATKTLALAVEGETTADATITLARDANSGKLNGIDIKHGENLGEEELLEAIRSILERSELPPPKTVIVP